MIKRIVIFVSLIGFFLLIPPVFYFLNSQTITVNPNKVVYNLPYPGLLPDSPLFFIKEIRDKILEWSTRDNLKKAELYLLLSDKKVAMAQSLAQKGKDKQALTIFYEAEQKFRKIPRLIETSKKQGVNSTADFIQRVKLSNAKHQEVAETFLKDMPQGQTGTITQILDLTKQTKKEIEKL